MPLTPYSWSVIVAGRWNRAILTPHGIAARLFKLPPETPLEIEVPIDSLGPYRVTHNGLTVIATTMHLIVEPQRQTYVDLARAMEIARIAVQDLRETPVAAVGINVRYSTTEASDSLRQLTGHAWDADLSDQQFEIQKRVLSRSVQWEQGVVNMIVTQQATEFQLEFNIERRSQVVAEHAEWLRRGINEIEDLVCRLLLTMHIDEREIPHE
jgi:hypothetical protein